jgi:hypothetical protein
MQFYTRFVQQRQRAQSKKKKPNCPMTKIAHIPCQAVSACTELYLARCRNAADIAPLDALLGRWAVCHKSSRDAAMPLLLWSKPASAPRLLRQYLAAISRYLTENRVKDIFLSGTSAQDRRV